MRVLLSANGSRGDVQPLVALALSLRAAGQQARLCVPENFRDWIEGLGFPFTPLAPQPGRGAGASGAQPDRLPERVQAIIADQFATISAVARDCDVIVAAAPLPAARSVAQALQIRYVYTVVCPVFLPSPHHAPTSVLASGHQQRLGAAGNSELWARNAERFNINLGPALNRHRASVGLAPVDDVRDHIFTERPWLTADPVLAPWPGPANGTVFQTGAWIIPDDRPLSPDLETFLQAGEPPLYFGFGSMPMPADLAQVIVQAARQTGRRGIISAGWAGLTLTDRVPDCLVVGEVNLRRLFAQVAAVVHHGGAGTTTLAALAGAPQVIAPQRHDQPYWAQRVSDLGIGCAHAPGVPTADSLTAALDHALAPSVAARARSVGSAMGSTGARIAAENLIASSANSG